MPSCSLAQCSLVTRVTRVNLYRGFGSQIVLIAGAPVYICYAQKSPDQQCSYGDWSPAVRVPVDSNQHLDFASVATGKSVTFAVGSPAIVFRARKLSPEQETNPATLLRAFTLAGKPLG